MLDDRDTRVAPGASNLTDLRDALCSGFLAPARVVPFFSFVIRATFVSALHWLQSAKCSKTDRPCHNRSLCRLQRSSRSRYACQAQVSPRVDVAEAPPCGITSRRDFHAGVRSVSTANISLFFFLILHRWRRWQWKQSGCGVLSM